MADNKDNDNNIRQEEMPVADTESIHIPETLPLLPVTGFAVFPNAVGPISVKNETYVSMINEAAVKDRLIGIVLGKTRDGDTPSPDDCCRIATAVRILKLINVSSSELNFVCQGISRIHIDEFVRTDPYFVARVTRIDDTYERTGELDAMMNTLLNQFSEVVDASPQMPEQLKLIARNLNDYAKVIYFSVGNASSDPDIQQSILEESDIRERFKKAMSALQTEIQKAQLSNKIHSEIAQEINEQQREHLLREQLKKIQAELGQKDEKQVEIETLRTRIKESEMPEEAEQQAFKELDRLGMMSPAAAEYSVARTYLDWLTDLPWAKATQDTIEIKHTEDVLNEDHYDLEKIKKRIIEYVAVRKLKQDMKGPILCFYGPPGVGKTSLGQSIARSLGRKFIRMSLGGVRDEAEIRGHRRTYVGALPGRIIQGIKKAGTNNPVFMLDEIDKLGADFRGDPSSALLEVLDPEQNSSFADHYLEVTFDLSNVFFITTANIIDTIPPALRDRLEMLELPGYTGEEKLHIAKKYLVPKQIDEHGLTPEQVTIDDSSLLKIIHDYTREAGVRNLEREIGSVCRGIARKVAEGTVQNVHVTDDALHEYLGPVRFFSEIAERITVPGIATGLAWTPAGGDILFVEATKMAGKKGLTLTGHLGEVMKESAQTALSYIRANAGAFDIDPAFFESSDIHLHVPAGAISKDGPSAGVTMVCALASLLTGRLVRSDVGMTGEITLRGKVLPVGGIKEKVLAAKRAGLRYIILPKLNEKDLEEASEAETSDIEFMFADRIDEVISAALEPGAAEQKKSQAATGF